MAEPGRAVLAAPGGAAAVLVDEPELADVAPRIVRDQPLERRRGARAIREQGDAVDAQIRIDPGLGGDGADAGLHERTDAADARHRGRYRDAEHARACAARRDRKRVDLQHSSPSFEHRHHADRSAAARNFAGSTSGTASSKALVYSCRGSGEDRLAGARLDDASQIHDRDPVADVADHAEVMADEHVGQAELALHRPEQVQDLRLHRDVERRGRLVREDQRGPQDDRARDRRPLALAARQLVRVAVDEAGAEPDQLQGLADQAPPR